MDRRRARRGCLVRGAYFLVLVVACGAKRSEHDEEERVAAACVASEPRDVTETVTLRGRVTPPPGGDLAVASLVAGRLASVDVREGQKLSAGDVVASVDDAPSRDALQQQQGALAQVEANERNAVLARDRAKELVARGIAAKQELDDANARLAALQGEANAARATVDLARRTLGHVRVRTAFAGVVTHVWRGPGALVDGTAATPIVQVATSSAVELVCDATVVELARVAIGQHAETTFSTGVKVSGDVIARSAALDALTGLGTVRISMPDAPGSLPIGAFGTSAVVVSQRTGVATYPSSVVRGAVSDGAEVIVCADNKAHVKRAAVGWRDANRVELLGLGAGDRLASAHVLGLEDDQAIDEKP